MTYRKFTSLSLSGHLTRAALAGGALAVSAGGAMAQDDAGHGLALLRALGLAPANIAAAPVEASRSAAAPTPARPAGPALRAGGAYVVRPGDTLGSIAGRISGASVTWRDLCDLNSDVLADCDAVEVGTRIALPGGAAAAAATVDAGSAAGSPVARSPVPTPRPMPQSSTATEAAPPPPSETRLAALQATPPGGVTVAGIEALSGDALSLVGLGASPAPAANPSNVDTGPDAGQPVGAAAPASGVATAPASVADPEPAVEPASPPVPAAVALGASQPPAPVGVASAEPIELAAAAPLGREAEAEPVPDPGAGADLGSVDGSEVASDGPRVLASLSYGPGGLPMSLRSYHLHRIEDVAGGARVSGHVPGPYSTGTTGGAFLRLEDGFEGRAAGKTIRVTLTLSGPAGGAVAVAYSTNDLGNSGWRGFDLTPEPAEHVFEYNVPPLVRGNGDYVGIDPDPEGSGQAVTIRAIRVDVLAGEGS